MFDSDQDKKAYLDCVPDYTITDLRELRRYLGYDRFRRGCAPDEPGDLSPDGRVRSTG